MILVSANSKHRHFLQSLEHSSQTVQTSRAVDHWDLLCSFTEKLQSSESSSFSSAGLTNPDNTDPLTDDHSEYNTVNTIVTTFPLMSSLSPHSLYSLTH